MKTNYEAKQKRLANCELYERGLREGGSCLICRCWRRPCEACSKKSAPSVPITRSKNHSARSSAPLARDSHQGACLAIKPSLPVTLFGSQ